MGELGIILAIVLCAWVYAALHEVNEPELRTLTTQIITLSLTVGAIVAGIAAAI